MYQGFIEKEITRRQSVLPWAYPEFDNSRYLVSSQMEIQLQRLTIASRCGSNWAQGGCLFRNIGTGACRDNPSCIISELIQLQPFTNMDQLWSLHRKAAIPNVKCGVKLLFLNINGESLKLGNWWVISPHTLLSTGMSPHWLKRHSDRHRQ